MPSARDACVALFALTALACDGRPPSGPIPVHPVVGQVTYQGKPVPGALVVFHAANPSSAAPTRPGDDAPSGPPTPVGKTDADGKFKLHTYLGEDGAPVGSYRITVMLASGGEMRDIMTKQVAKAQTVPLPNKYADPKTSDITVDVKEGENQLSPFELKGTPGEPSKPAASGTSASKGRGRD
jgi:hypothetical protein